MKKTSYWHGILKVLRFAKAHWMLVLLALAGTGAYVLGEMAFLKLMEPFIDAFSSARHALKAVVSGGESVPTAGLPETLDVTVPELYRIGKLVLLLAPYIAVAAFAQGYLNGRVVWQLIVDMRNAICEALMPQSLSFFEDRRSGDLMSRITNDVSRAQGAFRQLFGNVPEQVLHVLGGVGLALYTNWKLTLVGGIVVPLVILPVGYIARRIRRYGREGLEKLSDLTDLMTQMFTGIRVIKAFKMEDAETQEFQRTNRKFLGKMMKMVTMRGLSAGTIELIIRVFIGAGALAGTYFIAHTEGTTGKDFGVGSLVVAMGGMYYAFQAVRRLVKAYNELQECIPAADRIFELIEHVPSLQDAADATALSRIERSIRFDGVSFAYDDEPVLTDVSFEARAGESVALVGKSGAGKSTLIALICRFYDVSSGAVEIDGIDVRQISRDSLLDHIAIVSQQTFLFNRSIAENIRYGRRDASDEDVEQAARAANIHDFIQTLPGGYDTLCGEFGAKLSGGQRQRITIARAVLKNADILILDEAMAGLDAESEALVGEALENLMHGRTTFVITHDLPTIRSAGRILVLSDGRLVEEGSHDELMTLRGEYYKLYGMQFPDH